MGFSKGAGSNLSQSTIQHSDPKESNATNKFDKSKFFTFLETKQEFFKKKKEKIVVYLTWEEFQESFSGNHPSIYYQLLDFLFGCNS